MPALAQVPQGGQIVGGSGRIETSGSGLTVFQTSPTLSTQWSSFSIGTANSVTFVQPSTSSVALNRVLGNDVSVIQGQLTANGQVFLLNPNGVLFTPTSQVNVGALVASTLDLADADFAAGRYHLSGGSTAAVVQQGSVRTAPGGTVALVAARVVNEGLIDAPQGQVLVGAGQEVVLDLGGPVQLRVEQGALDAQIANGGAIRAEGGVIHLSARAVDALSRSVINQRGLVEASSLSERGGRIVLEADDITLAQGSRTLATGAAGGGTVLVGGDWQGQGTLRQAHTVTMEAGAHIDVSATEQGDGGRAVLWSDVTRADSLTRAAGDLRAQGGVNGGNGGQIETSGHVLDTHGATGSAAARSANGQAGEWLFDPYNVSIGGSTSNNSESGGTWTPSADDSTIDAASIQALLEGGTSVTVTTGAAGSQVGDITVASAITKTTGASDVTLTLRAANSIVVDQAITHTGGAGKLNVLLDADNNNGTRDGAGIVILNNDISTGGGNLSFGTGATITLNGVSTLVGGDVYVAPSGSVRQLSTGGGALTVNGELLIANTSGLNIATQGGDVTLKGTLNSANEYDFVNKTGSAGSGSWSAARTEAIGATGGGSAIGDTYLVNIGSRLENAVAVRAAGYRGAWIGAWRPSTSSTAWAWANGPEGGTTFLNQNAYGGGSAGPGGSNTTPVNGSYQNFGSGEPNGTNSPTGERVGQFFGTGGQWNDLADTTTYAATQLSVYSVLGYVRETNLAASPLTINAGSGNVTFQRAVGNIKALASLNVTAHNVSVQGGARTEGQQIYDATGLVTQGGALRANGLALLGTGGTYTLTNTGNDVVTLAADTGSLDFVNASALTVGTVGAVSGVQATGTVKIETQSGDLTVAQNIDTSDASSSAVILNAGKSTAAGTATGGNVVLSGSPTITTGAGGRSVVYTGSVAGSTGITALVGSGSGNFRYNSDESSTGYTTALGASGLHAIYRERPVATMVVDSDGITYGDAVPTLTGAVTGTVNGDQSVLALTAPTYSTSAKLNAGSYAITPANLAALGYQLSGTAGTLTVAPRTLSVSYTGVDKVYNGLTDASVTTTDDRVAGDTLDITRSASFADKNAAIGKTVSVSGVSLSGTDAGNYTVASSGSTTADITPRTLSVSYTGVDKVYNGLTDASVTTTDDRIAGDTLTIARSASFLVPQVGTDRAISVTGVALGGPDAVNYVLASTTGSASASIVQDDGLSTATFAQRQLLIPQVLVAAPTLSAVVGGERDTLGTVGGLKMVPVDDDAGLPGAAQPAAASGSAPAAGSVPFDAADPLGFVRVFVVQGGLKMPAEMQMQMQRKRRVP